MILLTALKMPRELDRDLLRNVVEKLFSNEKNKDFFESIAKRDDSSSACESLFAYSLLYEQILSLPCRTSPPSDLILARNENGKPFFENSDVKFNISHSKGYVACAASVGEDVGVDVEASNITEEKAKKLAKRYFGEQEIAEVKKCPKVFARIWSEKEAKAKFFGDSVGNILFNEKSNANFYISYGVKLHRFAIDNIPITLCTKRDFSTISCTIG